MINLMKKQSVKEHNLNWPEIPNNPYRILIIGDSGSGKTNSLFNLIFTNHILIKSIHMLKIHMKQCE